MIGGCFREFPKYLRNEKTTMMIKPEDTMHSRVIAIEDMDFSRIHRDELKSMVLRLGSCCTMNK